MTSIHRIAVLLVCVLCLVGTASFAADDDQQSVITLDGPCCFENPRFTGTCQVQAGPEETCGSILAYLNNPNSVGKNYCGNTTIRGGWSQVSCQAPTSTGVLPACAISDTQE